MEANRPVTSAATEYDSVLKDFGPMSKEPATAESEPDDFPFVFKGSLNTDVSYNFSHASDDPGPTDHRGFSGLKVGARFDVESQLSENWAAKLGVTGYHDFVFQLYPHKNFTDDYIDQNENVTEFDEVWIRAAPNQHFYLKMGRQTVRWGKSSTIEVLDVLNPKDYRILGLADIEDLSLPVCMTRFSFNPKAVSINLVTIHEVRFNKIPVYGSDFYPAAQPAPPERVPESDLRNTQVGLGVDFYRHQLDFSLNAASYFEDRTHLTREDGTLERSHSRVNLFGGSLSYAIGSWVFYGESAYLQGLDFFNAKEPKDRWDVLVGFEYIGFNDTVISAEAVNRHLLNFNKRMEASPDNALENESRLVVNLKHDFFYDTLHLNYQLSLYALDGSGGAYQRFRADYDLTDHWTITGGVIFYESGDYFLLRDIGDNDRLFLNLSYVF